MVVTREFSLSTVGLVCPMRSKAILFKAELSKTTTASAFNTGRFNVNIELYDCTTTSLCESFQLGNTKYV
eukprot:CAMPEP_0171300580 /NCGR_PEP_ID=MMETSP0816-20121228/9414_1 /TAXON_ID=420281 /ORGANISM="Proboscia inermis, Strain CCAP1064/1" /LENGTH=69 /DNA_ID=CAMNT_0011777185 /DNA_START=336 /DNA_END=545 /DNA_ORIENTATION=+